MHVTTPNDR